jgi:myo-inositol catabolism protein IolS
MEDRRMLYSKLGMSELQVSVLGFGCWQFEQAWAKSFSEQDLDAAVRCAVNLGINWFDTAAAYGAGASEQLLGKLIAPFRERVVVATKTLAAEYSVEYLRTQIEESLRRLNTDVIDLFQIHWPKVAFATPLADDLLASLYVLQNEGKLRFAGISNFRNQELAVCKWPTDLMVANQLPYSLLWRSIESGDAKASIDAGLAVLAYSPLAQGYLAGRCSTGSPCVGARANLWFSQPAHHEYVSALVERIRLIAAEVGHSAVQVALNWLLAQPSVTAVVCGARSATQVQEQVAALDWVISNDMRDSLTELTAECKSRFRGTPTMWIGGPPTL